MFNDLASEEIDIKTIELLVTYVEIKKNWYKQIMYAYFNNGMYRW